MITAELNDLIQSIKNRVALNVHNLNGSASSLSCPLIACINFAAFSLPSLENEIHRSRNIFVKLVIIHLHDLAS